MVISVSSSPKPLDADDAAIAPESPIASGPASSGPAAPRQGTLNSGSLVGDYADQLMDDLFDDLERSLDEGVDVLPMVEAEPMEEDEVLALTPLEVPQLVVPESLLPPRVDRAAREKAIADAIREQERQKQSRQSHDRLLVGGALAALMATVGLWYLNRRGELQQAARETEVITATAAQDPNVDTAFVNYMQRSLDTIAANEQARSGGSSSRQPLPVVPLPMVPMPPGTALQPLPVPNGTAVVPPGTAAGLDIPLASNLTEAIERLTALIERMPANAPGAANGANPGNAGGSLPSPSNNPPPGPVAMESPAPTASPSPGEPPANTVAIAPKPTQSLVGLLDLGERSAALFAIDGVTRRFNIGETVGGSGWTLVEVTADSAKIRKDGETRTIYIGERF